MATPPLRANYVNPTPPLPENLSAVEYNLNATRTDAAYDGVTANTAQLATHTSQLAALTPSWVRGIVATMLQEGTGIDVSYNSTTEKLTITATGSGGGGSGSALFPGTSLYPSSTVYPAS